MSGMILRWGLPALLTVVGGTALAIATTSGPMTAELTARAAEALAAEPTSWATVAFESRDAVLTGTATDQRMIDEAAARVAAVHGVRSVRSEVVLAEFVSPFPFTASVGADGVALSGGVPDEALHAEFVAAAGASEDSLRLMSGAPPREAWRGAVLLALDHLAGFDEGEVLLADLELTISGRAKSSEAYDALLGLAAAPVPDGVTIASRDIAPPLASPFTWQAVFDGEAVAVSGFTPSETFAGELQAAGTAARPVATSLRLASGAPGGFEAAAHTLLQNLLLLEEGRAEISDSTLALEGAPPDAGTAARVEAAMTRLGASLTLAPPRVDSYAFAATLDGGAIILTGHVPDAATRDRLEALAGVDATALDLARGAPERFESAVDYGLGLLSHMSEGRFVIENTALSVEGRAATVADFEEIETTLSLGAPQGLILAATAVKPPLASPFTWSAVKAADGGVTLAGYVPSRAARQRLQTAARDVAADTTIVADGQPPNFEAEAGAALGLLPLVATGSIGYDGANWTMRGTVETPQQAFAADQAFARSGLREAGWSFGIELPAAPAPAALPVIDPYVWQARKGPDGRIALGGFVPTEGLKRILAARAGEGADDSSSLGAGHPDGFIGDVLAGLDALNHLAMGTVKLENGIWTLAGTPRTAEDAERAVAALGTATSGGAGWQKQLSAPLVAPAPEPIEPEPEPEPAQPEPPPAADEPAQPAPEPPAEAPAVADTPAPAPAPAPVVRNFVFSASKPLGGEIVLDGLVPADATRRFFGVIAGAVPTDNLAVGDGLPGDFIPRADAGIRLLAGLASGEFGLDGDQWVLTGRVETEAERAAVLAGIAATPAAAGWQTDITLLPAIDNCRQKIAVFATRNAILFQSGSARLAEESVAAIDELAGYLRLCPEAVVHIEGHTDADGPEDLNLALSVARAETVVEALIERGVAFQRLYAVGYGESLPIADNDTAAGKRANRRIAFTILDEHE